MQILFFALFYHFSSKLASSQTCPENLRLICSKRCSFLDGWLDLDCSPAQDLRELIKQLRFTNKPIKSLKMSENPNFQELPGKVFDTLKIKKLDLSGNGLTGLDMRFEVQFCCDLSRDTGYLFKPVTSARVADHQILILQKISPRAFMGLEDTLTDLSLAANKLTAIPDVANLRFLESLDISGNQLTGGEVKHDLFAHNPKLHVVKIDPDKAIYLLQDKADKVSDFSPALPAAPAAQVPPQPAAAAPKIVDPNSLNNPMNTLIFTSLLSDLLRNLPSIISGLQALQAISLRNNDGAATPLFPNLLGTAGTKSPAPQIDVTKVSPDLVHEFMANGGKIPGVPQDVVASFTQQYLEQMAKGNGQGAGQLIPSLAIPSPATLGTTVAVTTPAAPVPSKVNVSSISTNGFSGLVRQFTDILTNPNAPLPPLDSLPAELVNKVLSGGLIPGINASQIEAIKNRYMEQWFGAPPPGQTTHGPTTVSTPVTTTAPVVVTTTTVASSTAVSTTATNVTTQGPTTTMAPILQPTTVKISDKAFDVKTNEIQTTGDGKPIVAIEKDRIPHERTPIQKIPDLDVPLDRPEQNTSSSNTTLYIILALVLVSLATVALIVYFCYNLKRNKKRSNLEEPEIANSNRTIYIGTPPNANIRRIPAISNIPRKITPSTINDQSTFDSIRDSPPIFTKKTPISEILERKQSQAVKMVPPLFQSSPKKQQQENLTRDTNDILSSATTTMVNSNNGVSRKWTISGPMGQNKF